MENSNNELGCDRSLREKLGEVIHNHLPDLISEGHAVRTMDALCYNMAICIKSFIPEEFYFNTTQRMAEVVLLYISASGKNAKQ